MFQAKTSTTAWIDCYLNRISRGSLKSRVKGKIRFHHEFGVTIAECPNACSQPRIRDIGIIGALVPAAGDAPCSLCGACVNACKENALALRKPKLI